MPVNGLRLFRLFGIEVFLSWLWLPVAILIVYQNAGGYDSTVFAVAEYVALFGIVLMHEFGHALACRSVGGRAERIVLWPLGGVAYVQPPPRPGAVLWAIAAGPLVNVALLPLLGVFWFVPVAGELGHLLYRIAWINAGLLIFNLLPIYPLDGGQILQSLLWFAVGRWKSLAASSVIGGIGVAGLGALGLYVLVEGDSWQAMWIGLMAAFAGSRCWVGWKHAQMLRRAGEGNDAVGRGFAVQLARRAEYGCPACGAHPPHGAFWFCPACHARFDKFDHPHACPACGTYDPVIPCPDCHARVPYAAWHRLGVPLQQGELIDG